jgi:hypothetical protein
MLKEEGVSLAVELDGEVWWFTRLLRRYGCDAEEEKKGDVDFLT